MVAAAEKQFSEFRLLLTSNTGARVKRVHHNGRDYLVAPASLIVPGVLNGSDGAGYYPLDECVKNMKAWDDMPIVVYHPTKNGSPVAAQDPEHQDYVLRESGIGFLRNTRDVGKLASEAWFDEEYVQDYDRKLQSQHRIYPRLLRNESIELSTGLIVHKDYTPGTCPKTGKSYDWVARNHVPDHLAVLPDQRGACSVQDGCGITVNADEDGEWITIKGTHVLVKDGEIVGGPPSLVGKGKKESGKSTGSYTPPKGSIYADVPRAGNNISIHDTPHAKDLVSRLDKYERKWIDYESKNPKASEAELHREAMYASGLLGDGLTTARGYADKKASSKPGVFFPNKTTKNADQPSDRVDPDKACQILHDGTANGHELTDQQRKMFGAACNDKPTENWCNQYGGDTCKGGKEGAKSPSKKSPKVAGAISKGRAKAKSASKSKPSGLDEWISKTGAAKGGKWWKGHTKNAESDDPLGVVTSELSGVVELAEDEAGRDLTSDEVDDVVADFLGGLWEETTENSEEGWVTLPNGVHIQIKDGEIVKGPDVFAKAVGEVEEQHAKTMKAHGKVADAIEEYKRIKEKNDDLREKSRQKDEREFGPSRIKNEETDMAVAMTPEIRKGLVDRLVINCKCGENADAEVLNKLSDRTLLQLNAMPEALAKAKAKVADPEEESEGEDMMGGKKCTKNKETQLVANQERQPMTAKEWLEAAPPEIRSAVTNALQLTRNAKQHCVDKLVAAAPESARKAYGELLANKELPELEIMVQALPPTRNVSEIDQLFAPVYAGGGPEFAGGRPTQNAVDVEPELVPVVNWEEEQVREERASRGRRTEETVGA